MEKIDIVLWVITGGFALMLVMWKSLNGRMDRIDNRMEKFDEKLTDVDRRLCRMEGAMTSKDCCILKDDRQQKKCE